jgi:hypothetical protein
MLKNGIFLTSIWLIILSILCGASVGSGMSPSVVNEDDTVSVGELMALMSTVSPSAERKEIIPVDIDCFDDSSEWTSLDGVTIEDVSEYEGDKAYLCGNKDFSSILMTKLPASGSYNYSHMMKLFSEPKDFSGCNIACRLKLLEGSGVSHISNIYKVTLRFIDENGIFADRSLSEGNGPGWKEAVMTQDDFSQSGGKIDWSRIASVAVVLFTKANATPSVILDRLMLFKDSTGVMSPHAPIVINTFDDDLCEQYDAAAYLSGKGMAGTFYVIGRTVDEAWPTCLTLTMLQDMKYAGHLIANHTWDHVMPFDGLTLDEQGQEITMMSRWMCLHGLGDGARILATPGNVWNPQMDRYLAPYYDNVRQVLSGGGLQRNPLYDKKHLRVTATDPNQAIAQVKQAIEDSNSSVVIYMGHKMENDTLVKFKVYVDFLYGELQAGNVRVSSPAQLLRL